MTKVRKAVIAAAGLGTRFLPQTKAMPKEMLPVIDKPVIQIIVEDLVAAGVTDIIIVTGAQKRAIEDHFDRSYELEQALREKGKDEAADTIKQIGEMANFIYVRQKGKYGTATPLLNVQHLLNGEPFFYLYADDFYRAEVPAASQLIEAYEQTGGSVMPVMEVSPEKAGSYGMIDIEEKLDDKTFRVRGVIEKPGPEKTPSNYASVTGYLFTPDIIPYAESVTPDKSGELQISEAVDAMARNGGQVHARVVDGVRHDTGQKHLYLQAIVDMTLEDPVLGDDFRHYLEERLKR